MMDDPGSELAILRAENERLRKALAMIIKNSQDWRGVRRIASQALAESQ